MAVSTSGKKIFVCLSAMRGFNPLQVPGFSTLQFAGGFDVEEGNWGGTKVGVKGGRGVWDWNNRALFSKVVSSLVTILV